MNNATSTSKSPGARFELATNALTVQRGSIVYNRLQFIATRELKT